MIVDELTNWDSYQFGPAWEKSFEFLKTLHPTSPDGETLLQGEDIIARVMSYNTKSTEEAKLEAHDRYIDIQSTLLGAEALEWFVRKTLVPRTDYNSKKDVTYFEYPGRANMRIDVQPGTFVMLFPHDAHMPALAVGKQKSLVKKVVIKLDIGLLRR